MVHVLILTDDDWNHAELGGNGSPVQFSHIQFSNTLQPLGVAALKHTILTEGWAGRDDRPLLSLHVTTPAAAPGLLASLHEGYLLCPLTLNLPESLPFTGQSLYQTCRQVTQLQHWVEHHLGYVAGTGTLWLPVIWTVKGPLYAEVIAREGDRYRQPVYLPDHQRQPLYRLGYRLLSSLKALPSVYLIQFGFSQQTIVFDRLYPFPAEPAIASVGVQSPDLFACYWYCLTAQPIRDVKIAVG